MQYRLTVEELCKKLRPIFGSKIDKVYLKYKLADSLEAKQEIEQALNALYHKHLDSNLLSEKVLLENPPEELISDGFPLANVSYNEQELYPFALRDKDFVRHVCISGMSGSGKTNFAFHIIKNLIKNGKPFIILDWKKSFRPLMIEDENIECYTVGNNKISNFLRFNINRPPKGVDPKEWVKLLCDLITECFFASFGVHKVLLETLDRAFRDFKVYEGSGNYPTWIQIKDRLEQKAEDLRSRGRESEWITSSLRIAYALTFGDFGEAINHKGKGSTKLENLLDRKVLLELTSLSNVEKKFFCDFLLTYLYKYKKINQEGICKEFKSAIIVDEAHNVFLKDRPRFIEETVTDMIYREMREYGIGLICLDQHISKLSDTVTGNSACNIAFNQMLPNDIEVVCRLMNLVDRRNYFSMLPVGSAIVKLAERYSRPFVIKVGLMEFDGLVTDKDVKEKMKFLFDRKNRVNLKDAKKEINRVNEIFKVSGVDVSEQEKEINKVFLSDNQELIKDFLLKNLMKYELEVLKDKLMEKGHNIRDINKIIELIEKEPEDGVYKTLNDDQKRLLKFVCKFPCYGTSKVYEYLNLSPRKGNKIKSELEDLGLVKVVVERSDKGWKKIIQPSK